MNADGLVKVNLKRPITLTGKVLTLRAGEKKDGTLYQPRLKSFPFYESPQTLFHLTGAADLTLENLSLSLELREQAEGWSMFSVAGDRLTLRDCTVTLNGLKKRADTNALLLARGYQPPNLTNSSLVELTDPDRRDRAADGEFYINSERCLLRGQGDLVRIEPDRGGELAFVQTAVSVQSAAVRMSGADAESPPPTDGAGRVSLNLDNSTLLFGEALLDLRWEPMISERPPLPLRVFATDCLFVDADEAVLIRTKGGDQAQLLDRLEWTGAGTNHYLLDRFWIASGLTPDIVHPAGTFEAWQRLAQSSGTPVMDTDPRHRDAELESNYLLRFPNLITRQDVQLRVREPLSAPAGGEPDADVGLGDGAVPPAVFDEPPPGADPERLPPSPGVRTARP